MDRSREGYLGTTKMASIHVSTPWHVSTSLHDLVRQLYGRCLTKYRCYWAHPTSVLHTTRGMDQPHHVCKTFARLHLPMSFSIVMGHPTENPERSYT
jgi:hypothetical protein